MKMCVVIFVLCLLTSEQGLVQASTSAESTEVDNKVTEAEFLSEIATGYWLGIYSVIIGNPGAAGKSNIRWRQSGSEITREISFLGPANACLDVNINYSATETDGEVQLNEVGGVRLERFYTQDPTTYFWWLICLVPSNNGEDCITGYFDLQIRDNRAVMNEGEIDLAGLPWDYIATDLEDIRNVRFDDTNGPEYIWLGEECPLPAE